VPADSASRSASAGRRLLIIAGSDVHAVELPARGALTVGRGVAADIRVDDRFLSRVHLTLHVGARVAVEDLGSSNGTFLRGERLAAGRRVEIGPGEAVHLGDALLVLDAAFPVRASPAGPGGAARARPAAGALERLHAVADRVARSPLSVLLLGDTGVGKGVLARRIHDRSPRAARRFLELNCAALPEPLLESELFGHERGAFTGAVDTSPGLLELANGGTMLLDEVGELPLPVQAKLLRVIEDRLVLRVGGRVPRAVDVRFIAATNRNLAAEVARGAFRQDLYYRLTGITLVVPPLRERLDELEGLAGLFLAEASAELKRGSCPALSGEALRRLREHPWPGNVRELRHALHRAVALCDGAEIAPEHLLLDTPAPDTGPRPPAAPALEPRAAAERDRIREALERCAGNQTRAARLLGMSRTTLAARLTAYGFARPRK
jgi:transcriptional regulator with GAF, ATPase, and Fis domain